MRHQHGSEEALVLTAPHPRAVTGTKAAPSAQGRGPSLARVHQPPTASSSPAQDDATQAGGGGMRRGGTLQVPAPAFSWDGAGMPRSRSATGLDFGCLWEGSAVWKSTHTPVLLVSFQQRTRTLQTVSHGSTRSFESSP